MFSSHSILVYAEFQHLHTLFYFKRYLLGELLNQILFDKVKYKTLHLAQIDAKNSDSSALTH